MAYRSGGIGCNAVGSLALAVAAGQAAAGLPNDDLVGKWVRRDGASEIAISACGDKICAVNIWVRDPDGSEKPGDELILSLRHTSPTELDGRAYDKRRELSYAMEITFGPAGMRTEGCVLLGLLCKSAEWTRIP